LQVELRGLLMSVNPQVDFKDTELDWIVDEVGRLRSAAARRWGGKQDAEAASNARTPLPAMHGGPAGVAAAAPGEAGSRSCRRPTQADVLPAQVFRSYGSYVSGGGLTVDGLQRTYDDGAGGRPGAGAAGQPGPPARRSRAA
jgi:hypothetical protein